MSELGEMLKKDFQDRETRHVYCEEFLNSSIATQIKVLREQRGLTQAELAKLAGMKQSRIAAIEDVNYSAWSVSTLKRIAEALDLALTVQFDSFGSKLHDIIKFRRESLERPSFEKDPVFRASVVPFGYTRSFDESSVILVDSDITDDPDGREAVDCTPTTSESLEYTPISLAA